ncbi:MAG: hypothetical protein Q7T56_12500 [Nocardioidaceae bacterium]|nr:hypothetical protein [Nocardioidaceae bacterium]
MDGRRIGALVGAAGGLAFVVANAGPLDAAGWVRAAGVIGFVVVVWVVARRRLGGGTVPDARAVRAYGWSVIAMVVAIVVGARLLALADETRLVPLWVVAAVGLHFVPFARAFGQPMFLRLAAALVSVAVAGTLAELAGVPDAVPWSAVLAGVVLLVSSASPGRPVEPPAAAADTR